MFDINNSLLSSIHYCNYVMKTAELRNAAWIYNDNVIDINPGDIHEEAGFSFAFDLHLFNQKIKEYLDNLDGGFFERRRIVKQLKPIIGFSNLESEEFLYNLSKCIDNLNEEELNILKECCLSEAVYKELFNKPINITKALVRSGFIKVRTSSKELIIEVNKLSERIVDQVVDYLSKHNNKIENVIINPISGNIITLSFEEFLNGPKSGVFSKR